MDYARSKYEEGYSYMGKAAMGGLTSLWKDRGDKGETSESFGVPDCSIRSGDLDNEKT